MNKKTAVNNLPEFYTNSGKGFIDVDSTTDVYYFPYGNFFMISHKIQKSDKNDVN